MIIDSKTLKVIERGIASLAQYNRTGTYLLATSPVGGVAVTISMSPYFWPNCGDDFCDGRVITVHDYRSLEVAFAGLIAIAKEDARFVQQKTKSA